jgi:hypothetical protein
MSSGAALESPSSASNPPGRPLSAPVVDAPRSESASAGTAPSGIVFERLQPATAKTVIKHASKTLYERMWFILKK